MSGKVLNMLKTIYFLKGNNADNSNLILLGLEKQRGVTLEALIVHFSLYNLYKIQKFSPFDFEPYESIIRSQCIKTFQKIYSL